MKDAMGSGSCREHWVPACPPAAPRRAAFCLQGERCSAELGITLLVASEVKCVVWKKQPKEQEMHTVPDPGCSHDHGAPHQTVVPPLLILFLLSLIKIKPVQSMSYGAGET